MPIRRGKGVVFSPQVLSAMGQAVAETTAILGIDGDDRQREIVAKFIIRLARQDDSLDAIALRGRVLKALGARSPLRRRPPSERFLAKPTWRSAAKSPA